MDKILCYFADFRECCFLWSIVYHTKWTEPHTRWTVLGRHAEAHPILEEDQGAEFIRLKWNGHILTVCQFACSFRSFMTLGLGVRHWAPVIWDEKILSTKHQFILNVKIMILHDSFYNTGKLVIISKICLDYSFYSRWNCLLDLTTVNVRRFDLTILQSLFKLNEAAGLQT